MGLTKRTYVDGETVITAENLNDIQDAIIENEEDIAEKVDISDMEEALNDKADIIVSSASGSIASFPDGAPYPVKDLVLTINPVQSGTGDPSPTNVRPITGHTGVNVTRTGKNLIDPDDIISSANINSSGRLTQGSGDSAYKLALVPVVNGVSYTMSGSSDVTDGCVFAFFASKPEVSDYSYDGQRIIQTNSRTFIAPINGWVAVRYKTDDISPQIEVGSTSSAYVPFAGSTTIPISWQSSVGTVYAATLDALVGKLKTRPYYASYNGETLIGPWISSMDAYTPGGTPTTGAQVVDLGGTETEYTIDGITLSTLLGENNIWADCGPILSVEYRADTGLYIAGQQVDIRASIAPVEDGTTASQAYAQGKYFFHNGDFCKAKTAIASGATFTLNTNYEVTTVAAELFTALNS